MAHPHKVSYYGAMPHTYLTPAEVAERLRVAKMTVLRLIYSGELPALRVGRQFRIPTEDVESYLTRQRVTS